ncbi:MAG TPA: 50S ribosomal protein L35 [Nitrospiraceae bacterium]|jgi:large subunit ribosomal protein L35
MKVKTHSGAAKRFAKSGSGKIMRRQAGKRHILTSKRRNRKRRLSGTVEVDATKTLALRRLLPS